MHITCYLKLIKSRPVAQCSNNYYKLCYQTLFHIPPPSPHQVSNVMHDAHTQPSQRSTPSTTQYYSVLLPLPSPPSCRLLLSAAARQKKPHKRNFICVPFVLGAAIYIHIYIYMRLYIIHPWGGVSYADRKHNLEPLLFAYGPSTKAGTA